MNQAQINEAADYLHQARKQAEEVERLTAKFGEFTLAEAYAIQSRGIDLRVEDGERILAYKMGLTSEGKRKQMGLDSPIYGVLTDLMRVDSHEPFKLDSSIHPKIEPEIAFFIDQQIEGCASLEEVMRAISMVCPTLEVLDSRYVGFKYFSLPDVVADNASSFKYILGEAVEFNRALDYSNLKINFKINGETAHEAMSSEISGNPMKSIVEMAKLFHEQGRRMPTKAWVLAGAATPAVSLSPQMKVELNIEGLGYLKVDIA